MTRTLILLLAIVLLATLVLACAGGGDDWQKWQGDVLERQRQGLPTWTPTPTATPQPVAEFAWGG